MGILLAYLPVVGSVATVLLRTTGSEAPAMYLAAAWGIAYVAAGHRLSKFPCPACREPFHLTPRRKFPFAWGTYHPLAKRCVRCGHPKWSAPS